MTYHPFGIYLAVGGALTLMLMALTSRKLALPRGSVALFGAVGVPLAFLCARLVFCLADIGYYTVTIAQPARMLHFWDGGYSLFGACLGLALGALITARLTKGSFGALADSLFSFLWVFIILERLGEGGTLLGLGREVQTEWMREIPFFAVEDSSGYLCHGVFRYEAVIALIGLIISLCLVFSKKTRAWPKGDLALIAISFYGCAQVVLESMRDDGHMVWGFIRANQLFAVFLPAAALIVFTVRGIQHRGGKITKEPVLWWLLGAAAIGLGIIKEFDVDTSTNLWIDYGVMSLAVLLLYASVWLAHGWERKGCRR